MPPNRSRYLLVSRSISLSLILATSAILISDSPAAPIAGVDFDNGGGGNDMTPDDLDPSDSITVSAWSFSGGGGISFDPNANTGRATAPVGKLDGPSLTDGSAPPVGSAPPTQGVHSFSITIGADTVIDLTGVEFAFSRATGGGNQRWLAFRTSLDSNLIFSQNGVARPGFPTSEITLSGAQYQGLTDQTVTFFWYSGGQGSGDCDIDSILIEGGVIADPPVVDNTAATNIQPSSAALGGNVTDTGGAPPTTTLYWGDNDAGTSAAAWDNSVNFGSQEGNFSTGISGLAPSTTYYFRCFASNSGGSDWANSTASFTTAAPPDPPSVINNSATNVAFEEADINGTVTGSGGETPDVTLYFGDNDGGTSAGSWDNSVDLGPVSGSFTNSLFFLDDGTTYYFRAFAQNSGGSAWAPSSASFTTLAFSPPTVGNSPASNLTGTAALVGGSITGTGGQAPSVTIYYGDNDGGTSPGNWDASAALGSQSASFETTLSGLSPLTTYYFRCFAQNSAGAAWADSTLSFTTLDTSELIITEFMAANDGGLTNDPNDWYPIANQVPGTTDDWIEIHNSGNATLDLGGWHLTDDPATPSKWTFPASTTLAAGGYLIVYASGDNAPDLNGNLHTNFKLSAGGEYVALVRPGTSIASEFGPGGSDYPPQDDDVSFGLHPESSDAVYFTSPTPGGPNDASGLAKVGDTKFSPDRGYYQTAIDVAITSDTPDAMIYYTTDGTPPVSSDGTATSSATLYELPIPLSQTTSIRAAAVKSGFAPTDIDAHTYILLDIDNANLDGTDSAGLNTPFIQQTMPPGWGGLASGDYNMDTVVSKSTTTATGHQTSTAQTMLRGMRDIPTISIAMDRDDFAGGNGIYSNPTSRGFAWERGCSAEFIPAAGDSRDDWQENCGLRVQGGASRTPGKSPKHSMSLRFRAEYGSGKLREPLFPGSAVEEFNVIALRAGYNNSWIHSDSGQRSRGSMTRDQWMRQSMLDMGNPAGGEGFMVHLFINGLYWGVHNLCERADASHYAAHNGGDEDLIDARNGSEFTDGNSTAWNQIDNVVSDGDWGEIQQVIDIDNYIDYQIINRYGGNADLKSNGNWRSAGGGPFPGGSPEQMAAWQLFSWDGERTLESQTSGTSPLDPMSANLPIDVRGTLEGYTEYRIRFADRLQKHFFNGGALTPASAKARWMRYATDLDRAIIAESARWGDHRGTRYTRDSQWLTEQNRLYNSYFPVRSDNVFNNYGSLFPDTDAPVFRIGASPQHGGEIPSGSSLSITASSGTIYYTTDGSDPRLEGGAINPGAIAISSGTTVALATSGLVRARARNGAEWSALDEAVFYIEPLAGPGDLAITEIHYNPYRANAIEVAAGAALGVPRDFDNANDFEFLEIRNIASGARNLDGVTFTEGLDFTFGLAALPAGGHIVIARDSEAFAIRYPSAPIGGTFEGGLDDGGERIAYTSSGGSPIQDFTYGDSGSWPGRPDGNGSSLESTDTSGDYNSPDNWRPSSEFNGSPGGAGSGPDGRILINEILSHTDLPQTDSIELHNASSSSINIGTWILSDDNSVYPSFSIPATTIAAGGYTTFD
ncbi:MAG: lamin tail domain-containing protein, partial [Verrucomicrobiales bacterium]